MNFRNWPLLGAGIAFAFLTALVGAAAWSYLPAAPAVQRPPPAAATVVAFDKDKAFAEFQARALGLPTVWTYPTPHPQTVKK